MAHLCHKVQPGITMLTADSGCPIHWLEEERTMWIDYARTQGWSWTIYPYDKFGLAAGAESGEGHEQQIHAGMFAGVHAHADREGLTCRAMGLRAEESRGRAASMRVHGEAYTYRDGQSRLLPIAKWRTADIWAYIVTHDLPWLSIYDLYGPHARNGLIGWAGAAQGRFAFLRIYYPDAYQRARELMGRDIEEFA